MTARDVAVARGILADYLAARGADEHAFPGAHEDADDFLFTFGHDERVVSCGGGVALVDKRSGAVALIGSTEQLERRARMTPVTGDDGSEVTACFVPRDAL